MKIDGYDLITSNNLERHDKTRLCAYIKSATRLKRIQPLEEQENEIIVLEDKTRLIAAIIDLKCFKGETQETNFKRLITNLTKLHTLTKKEICVPGDFNVDYNKMQESSYPQKYRQNLNRLHR